MTTKTIKLIPHNTIHQALDAAPAVRAKYEGYENTLESTIAQHRVHFQNRLRIHRYFTTEDNSRLLFTCEDRQFTPGFMLLNEIDGPCDVMDNYPFATVQFTEEQDGTVSAEISAYCYQRTAVARAAIRDMGHCATTLRF